MTERTITVKVSFDANSVAELVQKANMYKSKIMLSVSEKTANLKSIMGIISLGLDKGSIVTISASGDDSNEAVTQLAQMLHGGD